MYDAAIDGRLKALYILGEDVLQTDPSQHAERALRALDFLIVQELFLSETAKLAHVVLPGASFLEKDGTFTNGERRVQRIRQCLPPPGQAQADWRILCELMTVTGLPQRYTHPSEIMAEIARLAPPFRGLDYAALDGDGLQWPVPQAGHPGTSILHQASFPHGRAHFAKVDYLPSPSLAQEGKALPLRLTTGRVLAHYNSGSMTRRTDNRLLADADLLVLHPHDAAARGIDDGAEVTIRSEYGAARARARLSDEVAAGSTFLSFHYPETGTNRLTSPVLDRLADCPEYKLTMVEVSRAEG
jgi:formate dehydrogenase major subunit